MLVLSTLMVGNVHDDTPSRDGTFQQGADVDDEGEDMEEEVGGNGEDAEEGMVTRSGVDAARSERTDVTQECVRTKMRTEKENGEEEAVLNIMELKQQNLLERGTCPK